MTNQEIIVSAAIDAGLYDGNEAAALLAEGKTLDIHTVARWNDLGYMVRRGEHAKLKVKLWGIEKHSPEDESEGTKSGDDVEDHFVLRPAFLFTADQVEPIDSACDNKGGYVTARKDKKIALKYERRCSTPGFQS